jgi:TPR repeat protein
MMSKWLVRIVGIAVAHAATLAIAQAQDVSLKFEPLDLDYAKHCKKPPAIKVDRDWQQWQDEKVATPSQELVEIADAYSNGFSGLPRDNATAKKILEYIKAERKFANGQTVIIGARIAFSEKTDRDEMARYVKALEEEFARGNTSAAYLLGQAYELGNGVAVDKQKAVKFYRLSATVDNTGALIRAAVILKSLKVDEAEQKIAAVGALTNLVSAVERGDCSAANVLYNLYYSGELGAKDTALAMRWYGIVAKTGNTRAAIQLGNYYRLGRGGQPDLQKALFYTEMAAKAGDPKGAFETGRAYGLGLGVAADIKRATQYLEQAGEGGADKAWVELSRLYSPEVTPDADLRLRFKYLERGSKVAAPDTALLEDYADALLNGIGTEPNQKAAISPLQTATDAGSAPAAWTLGQLYFYESTSVQQDKKTGLKLIRFAATSGEPAAAAFLATLYRCGANVEQSSAKADLWQQRAGFFGNSTAMYDLAANATNSNPVIKELYLRQAVRNGSGKATVELVTAYESGEWSNPDKKLANGWEQHARADGDGELADDIQIIRALAEKNAGNLEKALQLLADGKFKDESRAAFERARIQVKLGASSSADALASFKQAVEGGNASAMWELYLLAAKNNVELLGHDKDYWLQSAANLGHAKAMIAIAEIKKDSASLQAIFESGVACSTKDLLALANAVLSVDGEKSKAKILNYLSTAEALIETGDKSALTSVGEALLSLGPDEQTRQRGEKILEKAAAAGDPEAARHLGIALAATADDTSNRDKAIGYLVTAFKAGDDKPIKIALAALRGSSSENAQRVFEKLTSMAPNLSAPVLKKVQELSLANDTVTGFADALIDQAANLENPAALVILADRKFSGFKSQRDIIAGFKLLERAAKTGDPEAQKALAAAYEAGFGVTQSNAQAQQIREGAQLPKREILQ